MSHCNKLLITACILTYEHEGSCLTAPEFAAHAHKLLQEKINTLFDKIKHGDQEHQDWLKKAIDEHFES